MKTQVADRWFYRDSDIVQRMADSLKWYGLPGCIICVGTPKVMGDRLGPFTGSLLQRMGVTVPVYGTIEDPVHGMNIREWVRRTRRMRPVLVIDSMVGSKYRVGTICAGRGKINARSGIDDKYQVPIGNMFIAGVVAKDQGSSRLNLIALSQCSADLVESMAQCIAEAVFRAFGTGEMYSAASG